MDDETGWPHTDFSPSRSLQEGQRDPVHAAPLFMSGGRMANLVNKREYNQARDRALKELARRHKDEYEQLMSQHLGRNLDQARQKAVRSRWDRDGRG